MTAATFLFLIGRPGSGKTTAFRYVSQQVADKLRDVAVTGIDDFSTIQQILKEDTKFIRHRWSPDGGFEILDQTVYDEALRRINEALVSLVAEPEAEDRRRSLVVIQFARSSYKQAFRHFSPEIVRRSLLIYLDCNFETCCRRNLQRTAQNNEENHHVPREVMEDDYFQDDIISLEKLGFAEIVMLDNNGEDPDSLRKQLQQRVFSRDAIKKGTLRDHPWLQLWQLELFPQPGHADSMMHHADRR
jgi:thymidylate kinase